MTCFITLMVGIGPMVGNPFSIDKVAKESDHGANVGGPPAEAAPAAIPTAPWRGCQHCLAASGEMDSDAIALLCLFLRYADVARLGSLSRRFRALNWEGWREAWRQCRCGQESTELVRVMCLAMREGRAEHVRGMVSGKAGRAVLMETDEDGQSCLLLAAWKGHSVAARALMDDGGKALVMLTDNNAKMGPGEPASI
jgi:hypothetical protein